MITIDEQLQLEPITISSQPYLMDLMMRIYRPVYQHLWFDDGTDYVQSQFNPDQLKLELEDKRASFYFVVFKEERVGIFRFIKNCPTALLPAHQVTKLHRIYLNPTVHGNGLGKKLMDWLQMVAQHSQQEYIWLESMDTQQPAIQFYERQGFQVFEPFLLDAPNMRPERRGMLRMSREVTVKVGC